MGQECSKWVKKKKSLSVERENACESLKGSWDIHRKHRDASREGQDSDYTFLLPKGLGTWWCWPCTFCSPASLPNWGMIGHRVYVVTLYFSALRTLKLHDFL